MVTVLSRLPIETAHLCVSIVFYKSHREEKTLKTHKRVLFVMVTISLMVAWTGSSVAQAGTATPAPNGVARQFKSGAKQVGEGAMQIGEGIKNGAIVTWEALKAGAAAVSSKFDSGKGSRTSRKVRTSPARQPQ